MLKRDPNNFYTLYILLTVWQEMKSQTSSHEWGLNLSNLTNNIARYKGLTTFDKNLKLKSNLWQVMTGDNSFMNIIACV